MLLILLVSAIAFAAVVFLALGLNESTTLRLGAFTTPAAFLANEAAADRRPRQTARTLDVAGYVAVREPFGRTAGWVSVVRSCTSLRSHRG